MILALLACPEPGPADSAASFAWDLPAGFPEPWVPEDNPMSAEKVELGRWLFYDERLSGNETQACASCHEQARAFTDGEAIAEGSTGEFTRRSSMSLAGIGDASGLTWASNAVRTLEDQALLPMFGEHPVELGLAGREGEMLARLSEDPEYPRRFGDAWPEDPDPITLSHVVQAISSFQRTLVSGNSAYDRFWYGEEPEALSASARRGMGLFTSERLECFHCHGGFAFSDSTRHVGTTMVELLFHNTALYNEDGAGSYPAVDTGLFEVTGVASDMGRFRAPTLRNIALTAPYMHDGSIGTLDEVLDHYAAGGRAGDNPYKSEFMLGFTLTEEERADILAFLDSLTDETFLADPRFADPEG